MNPARVDFVVDLLYGAMIFTAIGLILVVGTDVGIAFGLGVLVSYVLHVAWKMARFDPDWMTREMERTVSDTVSKEVERTVSKEVDDAAEKVGETVSREVTEKVEETVSEEVEKTVSEEVDDALEKIDDRAETPESSGDGRAG